MISLLKKNVSALGQKDFLSGQDNVAAQILLRRGPDATTISSIDPYKEGPQSHRWCRQFLSRNASRLRFDGIHLRCSKQLGFPDLMLVGSTIVVSFRILSLTWIRSNRRYVIESYCRCLLRMVSLNRHNLFVGFPQ